jgi:uncharacterized glyoxalase superfamily protein PhnB
MAERDPIERLNEALERGALDDRVPLAADIRELLVVARRLRGMPREEFRQRLRLQLEEKAMTKTTIKETIQLREGFRSLTPYIIVQGAAQFIDFMKEVFGAEEKLRVPRPDGGIMHAEVNIGDSMIELADGNEQYSPRPAAIHLYVPDTQRVFDRALAARATSLHPVRKCITASSPAVCRILSATSGTSLPITARTTFRRAHWVGGQYTSKWGATLHPLLG